MEEEQKINTQADKTIDGWKKYNKQNKSKAAPGQGLGRGPLSRRQPSGRVNHEQPSVSHEEAGDAAF